VSHLAVRDRIRSLDPVRDHVEVVRLLTCNEFPFDTARAPELALFRSFCPRGYSNEGMGPP